MKWSTFMLSLLLTLVLCLGLYGIACAQDKVSVDKKDYNEFRLMKINQEYQQIMADLRAKNPEQFKRIDALQAEANKLTKEMTPAQTPAKTAPKK